MIVSIRKVLDTLERGREEGRESEGGKKEKEGLSTGINGSKKKETSYFTCKERGDV